MFGVARWRAEILPPTRLEWRRAGGEQASAHAASGHKSIRVISSSFGRLQVHKHRHKHRARCHLHQSSVRKLSAPRARPTYEYARPLRAPNDPSNCATAERASRRRALRKRAALALLFLQIIRSLRRRLGAHLSRARRRRLVGSSSSRTTASGRAAGCGAS